MRDRNVTFDGGAPERAETAVPEGIRDGSVVSWEGVSSRIYGYVRIREGVMLVDLGDGHCFRLSDLLSSRSFTIVKR